MKLDIFDLLFEEMFNLLGLCHDRKVSLTEETLDFSWLETFLIQKKRKDEKTPQFLSMSSERLSSLKHLRCNTEKRA